jgi:predicted TIM-barrel fold metal-dependent hydrolase
VRKLLDTGKGWIKVSGLNMGSKAGTPGYSDTVAVVQSYIRANPERVLWGSNWPMPGEDPAPNIVEILNALAVAAESQVALRRILVENPETLFGFDPARRRPVLWVSVGLNARAS